ncbi:NusA-like transcription termination signal-binding factor [Halostagnicola kamekurae]|uniref:Probable transcription termination protein NusA n=1 Tax=Halostagnicola kamekurae TaxID=619731 RepID=A0A1I6PE32_9EURY|nr:NusA-like transcription termination signal-binding factor [Halostagnicola kamekurae]SFS38474.1 N utilization substance protein A [Halostagnicola kamekurae]
MDGPLEDEPRRYLSVFEDVTGTTGEDCLVDDETVVVVVASGELGEAIGPGGRNVTRFEERIDKPVRLVEDADDPETFVANALAPASVYNVTVSENDDRVAYVEVADEDRGVAIGSDGETIDRARTLAARHYEFDDVQLL